MKEVKAVYIHIPFCKSICHYCDFCKVLYQRDLAEKYISSLKEEILKRYKNEEIETIYIGGGTPSVFTISQLKKLFSILQIFHFKENYEFTIEGNIDSLTQKKIQLMKKYGVNRVSIGIETMNPKYQKELGRNETKEKVKKRIQLLRENNINNINIDLMYGFQNQTKEELKEDLEFVLSLNVPHLSIYSLMVEKNTILEMNKYHRINDDIDYEFYNLIKKTLKKYGYYHYELSNYAKKGFQSRHNLNYWNNEMYYGFGASAASYIGKIRFANTKSVFNYIHGKRVIEEEILTKKDIMDYELILNLRKKKGISKKEFYNKYQKRMEDIYPCKKLIEKGLLKENKTNIYIADEYWYVINEILINLFD